jgi:predicted DNA-binding mobile mystery protein A
MISLIIAYKTPPNSEKGKSKMARPYELKSPEARWLRIRQLDSKLAALRNDRIMHEPEKGWIREIRQALGMRSSQLAKRLGVEQATESALEQNEAKGSASIKSLRKAADALDCDLVYAFVPRQSLEKTVKSRIEYVARRRLGRVNQTMALEEQAIDPSSRDRQLSEYVNRLTLHPPRNLWEEP